MYDNSYSPVSKETATTNFCSGVYRAVANKANNNFKGFGCSGNAEPMKLITYSIKLGGYHKRASRKVEFCEGDIGSVPKSQYIYVERRF